MAGRLRSWYGGLSKAGKVVLWAVTAVVAGGTLTAANPNTETQTPAPVADVVQSEVSKPEVQTSTVTETEIIEFSSETVNDASLEKGKTRLITSGVNGELTITYEITLTDGVQTAKKELSRTVSKEPVAEVTAVGTKAATARQSGNCDPNYSGCVPIDSDVDCAGGRGNGPSYVRGPITVIGFDIYDLDGDNDGIACE